MRLDLDLDDGHARRWRHRAFRNRNRRSRPPADCAVPPSPRASAAGCGRARERRVAGRACAPRALPRNLLKTAGSRGRASSASSPSFRWRTSSGRFADRRRASQQSDEVHLVVVSRQLPTQQLGLAGQPAYCRLEARLQPRPSRPFFQPTGLPVQGTDFPAQRLVELLPRPFQRLAQPGVARGGEACAARFDLRSAATFLRNATSSSFCSCDRQRLAQPGVLSRQRPDRLAGLLGRPWAA